MSEYTTFQAKFFFNLCRFGLWLESQGYQVSEGEGWRTPEQAAIYVVKKTGILDSIHRDRMGQDLIIRDKDAAWKALHPLNRWGGDFKGKTAGDYQHFSQTYSGRS
jgi:hypothetical protein